MRRKPVGLDHRGLRLEWIARTYEEIRACIRVDPKATFQVEVRRLSDGSGLHMLWDATFLGHRYVYATATIEPFLDWNIENLSHMLRHAHWTLQKIAFDARR